MSLSPPTGQSRFGAKISTGYRRILLGGWWQFLPGGRTIDGSKSRDPDNTGDVDVLRAGLLMGKITSGGKYAPSIMATLGSAAAASATTLTLASSAQGDELVRRIGASGTFILRGPPTAAGTIASEQVTYSAVSGATVTVTAITNAYVAGSLIQPEDGSEIPKTLLPDGFGIQVTDADRVTNRDQDFSNVPVGVRDNGVIDASQIINYSADASIQAWIKQQLNAVGFFPFDDDF